MDDDDLIPFNPAHFGHVDFKSENDGQLTIFFEDTHEPPDPDDFASIADYEIAWTEWEEKQSLTQQEDTIMTFNFTAPIDNEIAQLQAKLAELEARKQLLASRESCANKILEQVGECVIEMKQAGVGEDSLFEWANTIFAKITGDFLPREKLNESQDQIEYLTKERDEALQKCTDLANANLRVSEELMKCVREKLRDAKHELETSDAALVRELKNTIAQLTIANNKITEEVLELRKESPFKQICEEARKPTEETDNQPKLEEEESRSDQEDGGSGDPRQNPVFELNDHVQVVQAGDDKDLLHRHGKITGMSGNQVSILFHKTDEFEEYETILSADCLKILPGNSDMKTQEIVAEFLRKLDRISRVDKLDWVKLKELPLNIETMRELGLQVKPKTKTHSYLMHQMPAMCANYINKTGDNSDLGWLPDSFKNKVEELLKAADTDEEIHEDDLDEMTELAQNESGGELRDGDTWEAAQAKKSMFLSEFKVGDTVIMRNPESPYLNQEGYVLDSKNGWLNVKDPDGATDMWQVSDVELVANSAA